MNTFMDEDFLLSNDFSKKLYHDYAEKMPIIDYHCHINPELIMKNHKFSNLTEIWLSGDHYKWRLLRSDGVSEKYITGDACDYDKFLKWSEVLPKAIGNPLHHWSHLELKRYFNVSEILMPRNAKYIWEKCNQQLDSEDMRVRNIIEASNVKLVCTTDDPIDTLEAHQKIRQDKSFKSKVIPAFRPDKVVNIEKKDFLQYIECLEDRSDIKINDLQSLFAALRNRMDFFEENGCKTADHGLDYVPFSMTDEEKVKAIFYKALNMEPLSVDEIEEYKTALMIFFAKEYSKRNWVMQLHFGVIRNSNTKMFNKLGPDTGYDCISGSNRADKIIKFLDSVCQTDELPKTILYSLSPNDNEMIDTIIGCFQESFQGKIQHGAAWWFNDTKNGIEKHISDLASSSLLANFVGMLTDSRSIISYTRHEYFRRILCNFIGRLVESGEYPGDIEYLGKMVQDISYNNAVKYFGFDI